VTRSQTILYAQIILGKDRTSKIPYNKDRNTVKFRKLAPSREDRRITHYTQGLKEFIEDEPKTILMDAMDLKSSIPLL